jgi:hypothetical protein
MKVFIAYSHDGRKLAYGLAEALVEAGHEVYDPTSSMGPGSLGAQIATAVRNSDAVIALVTYANPNVYYEAGLATGAHVPVLVAADRPDQIAFALSSAPYVQLTGNTDVDVGEILRRVADVWPERPAAASEPRSTDLSLADVAADVAAFERLTPPEFEHLVLELLRGRGLPAHADPVKGDRGFDILIDGDPPTVVEVKRYSKGRLVPVGVVRQVLGTMVAAGAGRAILVSSSGFTKSAMAAAAEWPIDLLTLEELLRPEA